MIMTILVYFGVGAAVMRSLQAVVGRSGDSPRKAAIGLVFWPLTLFFCIWLGAER